MRRRGIDHQLETLLGRWKFRDVVVWMCSADVLLHRTIALFLGIASMRQQSFQLTPQPFDRGVQRGAKRRTLTPKQRFRQFEPS